MIIGALTYLIKRFEIKMPTSQEEIIYRTVPIVSMVIQKGLEVFRTVRRA